MSSGSLPCSCGEVGKSWLADTYFSFFPSFFWRWKIGENITTMKEGERLKGKKSLKNKNNNNKKTPRTCQHDAQLWRLEQSKTNVWVISRIKSFHHLRGLLLRYLDSCKWWARRQAGVGGGVGRMFQNEMLSGEPVFCCVSNRGLHQKEFLSAWRRELNTEMKVCFLGW